MTQTLKQKIFSGVFWQGLNNGGNYLIGFVLSMILARLLTPEDFGIVAILMVFNALCGVFIDSGFASALIQKKDLHPDDCSSVFFLNIAMAMLMYGIMYFAAPYIANFYEKQELTLFLRVISLTFPISSLSLVQSTLITREMQFNVHCRINFISCIVSGVTGVILAFRGLGAWALIAQILTGSILTAVLLWFWGKWRPVFRVKINRLKSLFQFGWKLFCSALLDCFYANIYSLLIGKLFNLSTLSYYNRGVNLPKTGVNLVNSTLGSVLFPAISSIQDEPERIRRLMKKAIQVIMFFITPGLTFLFIAAEPIVLLLFGEQWRPAVPFMQVFCFSFFFYPLHTINLQLLTASGRSDVFLVIEIIKKAQAVIIILLTYRYGALAMAQGFAASSLLTFIENSWMSRKLVKYNSVQQLWDTFPFVIFSVTAGTAAWITKNMLTGIWLQITVSAGVFCCIYLAGILIFKQIPEEAVTILKEKLHLGKKVTP